MQCPNCDTPLSAPAIAADEPPVFGCSTCHGVWIDSNAYLAWVTGREAKPAPELTIDETPVADTQNLKLCPTCRRFLMRYHILPGSHFFVERCGHCNGVWFDEGEWASVRRHGLQDRVNQLFTQPWQDRIRAVESRHSLEQIYLDRFGGEDYRRVREIRAWLDSRPQKAMLLAFLQSRDPYQQ